MTPKPVSFNPYTGSVHPTETILTESAKLVAYERRCGDVREPGSRKLAFEEEQR
jgi:hypothetical protein